MNYEEAGSGEKALILMHGWGGSTESWLPVMRDFGDGFRVIAVDFPGFGKSPEPREVWSVDDYARLMIAFIRSLGPGKVDLIAHSFGGRVALAINREAPEIIDKQILTGCAGLPPRRSAVSRAKSGLAHGFSALIDNRLTRAVASEAVVERTHNALRRHFGSADYKNASPQMREIFRKVIEQDLTECLARVAAPTLLVWGENDTATPLWMGQEMEKAIRDAGLVVFPGSGHFAYLEQYARFQAIARKFLLG